MADHQHAADAVPDGGTAPDAAAPSTGAPGAAGEDPRAHERAGAHERARTREERGAPEEPGRAGEADVNEETATADTGTGTGAGTGTGTGTGNNTGAGSGTGTRPPGAPEAPASPADPGLTDDRGRADGSDPAGSGLSDTSPHKFRRDRGHKMLAGVCAGLGRQCDMDPVIFRITLAVLSATGGIGLIFYGFAWLFVPYADDDENEVRKLLTGRVDGQALAAVLFALVGCGVLLSMLNNGGVLTFAVVLSFLLAGAGYWSRHRDAPDADPLAAQAVADAPPEAQAPPVPAAYPSWWRDPIVKDGTHYGGTGYLWGPRDTRTPDITSVIDVRLTGHTGAREDIRTPHGRSPRARGPRWIGGWLFLLALLAGGLATRLTWDEHPLGTSLQAGLATALIVLGLGIAVSSFLGRTGTGSVFLAIVTAGLLAGSATLPRDITTYWIDTTWRPATVADVREVYDLGTGDGTLDLSRLDLAKGQTVSTNAEVGLGRLRVIVPPDVTVKMSIDVGLGDIQLPGENQEDVDVEPGKHKEVTLSPVSGGKDTGTIDLDLQVGAGQAEVARAAS
ncbi:PspC domain-containing protein [Streptomyces aurantiogriseus]|uniref:Membrane protein n=1 Tax=Streptomyces aurantiogriseus TaxID=66870 RepID=A0A918C139_9ACTN|nr:PspC domain-containing protein [Streptomyces aurantiogriseus]GGR00370.1 membrane protein [Streptomyces aurantiogriseus]